MSNIPPGSELELPDIDERLVAPETRYEIMDGVVIYVPPADPLHGENHSKLAALVEAHRHPDFTVAVDLLTRTSRIDDFAPDVSVYPTAKHPVTGGRQLEQIAFEIASTESLGHAGKKAGKLTGRGVRRVFAIDVERERVLEWSTVLGQWSILDLTSTIADPALAVALPVAALVDAARADDAIVAALRAKRHAEFLAEREEGREEGRAAVIRLAVLRILSVRGLSITEAQRARIEGEHDPALLEGWFDRVATCESVESLLA